MQRTLPALAPLAVATTPTLVEHHGRAMGSKMHIIATGERARVASVIEWAVSRVEELEQRWSRFIRSSDVSRINHNPGNPVDVNDDTINLVAAAVEAQQLSGGRFDPTMLQALLGNGYDRTFVSIKTPVGLPALAAIPAPHAADSHPQITIDVKAGTVMVAAGTGFDPGGIGKGLAADLVATEMIERGAAGALVNLGGDIRCIGEGPDNGTWTISVGDVEAGVEHRILVLDQGGVASSTRCRRTWKRQTGDIVVDTHHLFDAATRESSPTAAKLVTVVAASCADAEWLATAIASHGSLPADTSMLGGATVLVTDDQDVVTTHGDVHGLFQ